MAKSKVSYQEYYQYYLNLGYSPDEAADYADNDYTSQF